LTAVSPNRPGVVGVVVVVVVGRIEAALDEFAEPLCMRAPARKPWSRHD
jgi:hypothetical protein